MSAYSAKCPSGHGNPIANKFCGECGVSLAGVCSSGHANPAGQRFCGECGEPLRQHGVRDSGVGSSPDSGPCEADSGVLAVEHAEKRSGLSAVKGKSESGLVPPVGGGPSVATEACVRSSRPAWCRNSSTRRGD